MGMNKTFSSGYVCPVLCIRGLPFLQEKDINRVADRIVTSPNCMSDLDAQHDLTRPPTRTPHETRIDHTLPLRDMYTANYQLHTVQTSSATQGHKYNTATVVLYAGRDRVSHSIEWDKHHLAVFGPAASHGLFLIASTPPAPWVSIKLRRDVSSVKPPRTPVTSTIEVHGGGAAAAKVAKQILGPARFRRTFLLGMPAPTTSRASRLGGGSLAAGHRRPRGVCTWVRLRVLLYFHRRRLRSF